jgi:hypothetical protein
MLPVARETPDIDIPRRTWMATRSISVKSCGPGIAVNSQSAVVPRTMGPLTLRTALFENLSTSRPQMRTKTRFAIWLNTVSAITVDIG